MKDKEIRYQYRKERTRRKLRGRPEGRMRLTVHRSLRYIYAQVVDDMAGKTVAAASSLSKEIKETASSNASKSAKNIAAAKKVGELLADIFRELGLAYNAHFPRMQT